MDTSNLSPKEMQSLGLLRPFPHNNAYMVSEDGRVAKTNMSGWLSPCVMKRGGYLGVNLWSANVGKMHYLHQVVAYTWLGQRPTPAHAVAHGDGDKNNNTASNLRWATKSENEADKILHGTSNSGERHGMAKLSNEQRDEIIRQVIIGPRGTIKRLSKEYGITSSRISMLVSEYNRRNAQ